MVKMKKNGLVLLLVSILTLYIVSAEPSTTLTLDTKTVCSESSCTKTYYSGIINYNNGSEYVPINKTIESGNFDGYSHRVIEGMYQVYYKEYLSWGDAIKYCNGKYCFTIQPSKLTYRNSDGSNDDIYSYPSTSEPGYADKGYADNNKFRWDNIFGTYNLSYNYESTSLKELLVLDSKPREPASYLGNSSQVTMDLDTYIKYPVGVDMYVDGEKITTDIITSEKIEFKNETDLLYYLPEPYAYDSNGTTVKLKYEIKWDKKYNAGKERLVWFSVKTKYSLLNHPNAVYPVYIDPTIKYNYSDTNNNKAYYYTAANVDEIAATATGTGEFASYTEILTNNGEFVKHDAPTGGAAIVQHNFHFTINETINTITEINITYSGKYAHSLPGGTEEKVLEIKTDSDYESIGTLTTSDADYSKQISSNFSEYLDANNKMYIRAFYSITDAWSISLSSDYIEIALTYFTGINVSKEAFNNTALNVNDSVRLNYSIYSGAQTIDKSWVEFTYPNTSSLNYTSERPYNTGLDEGSDKETGTQTHSGEYGGASNCSNNGACDSLGDGDCQNCPGCSWSSCPFIYSESGGIWSRQYEGFSSGAFNFPLVPTRHTMINSECKDGIRKIKIVEELKEESTITGLNLYEIKSDGTPYRGVQGETYIFKNHISPICTYNEKDCTETIKYSDDNELYTQYEEGKMQDVIYLEFDNTINSDEIILLIEGGKTNIIHNYYGLAMSMMRNKNLVELLSKTKIYQNIITDFMERLSPNVYVWDGKDWINHGSLTSLYSIYHDGTEIIKVPTYNQDIIKIKLIAINGGFRYDTINAELEEYVYEQKIIEPTKIMFRGKEVDTPLQAMKLSDNLLLEYSCTENTDVIVEIEGRYITEEGGFRLETPPNIFTSIKKLYNLFISKKKYMSEFDQTVKEYNLDEKKTCGQQPNYPDTALLEIIPSVQGACSGTISCSTHDSDQGSCEACNICTWNPAVQDTNANKTAVEYTDMTDTLMKDLTKVNVTVTVSAYDNSGSTENGNDDPDLHLQMYNGATYIDIEDFNVNNTGTYSLTTTDSTTLTAWANESNRRIKIYGISMDGTASNTDDISWTVVKTYVNANVWDGNTYTYVFNDTSAEGLYSVNRIFANTTDGTYSYNNFTDLNFTVTAEQPPVTLSYTLTMPSGGGTYFNSTTTPPGTSTLTLDFNWSMDKTSWIHPCIQATSCQTNATAIFQFTNTGTTNLSMMFNINATLPTNIYLMADIVNTHATYINLSTSNQTIISNLGMNNVSNVWLWSSMTSASTGTYSRKLQSISNETI